MDTGSYAEGKTAFRKSRSQSTNWGAWKSDDDVDIEELTFVSAMVVAVRTYGEI